MSVFYNMELSFLTSFYSIKRQRLDTLTKEAILAFNPEAIKVENACGCIGINALLLLVKEKGMQCRLIDICN